MAIRDKPGRTVVCRHASIRAPTRNPDECQLHLSQQFLMRGCGGAHPCELQLPGEHRIKRGLGSEPLRDEGSLGREQIDLLWELFEQIVRQCVEVGLVQGKHLSVDGSFVEANAAKESRIPREQLGEAAQVHHTLRQYLKDVEQQNPVEEPEHAQDQVSTTDPDSTYATKGGTPARLGYYDNYLVDNHSCVIVGVQATAARMSQETVAAQDMSPVSHGGKDERQNRWRPIPRTGTGSVCNGWRIEASLPTCGPVTVSIERGARSTVQSVSRTNPKIIAISVPQASHSTMVVGSIETAPTTTSGRANAVVRARKDRNAPVLPSGALSSTSMNQPGNAQGSW